MLTKSRIVYKFFLIMMFPMMVHITSKFGLIFSCFCNDKNNGKNERYYITNQRGPEHGDDVVTCQCKNN